MDTLTAALYELERQRKIYSAEEYELERLTALAEGVGGSSFGGTPHGGTRGDRMELAAIRLSDYRAQVRRDRRQRQPFKMKALAVIWQRLSNEDAYVLDAIYNRGLTLKQVADETGYSISWAHLHARKGETH